MKIKVRKKRAKLRRYLIKRLIKQPIKNIKIKDGWISFEYDDKKIKDKIVVKIHERHVGSWSAKDDVVFIDDNLVGKDRDAVILHEAVEKYVSQTYGLPEDFEAHKIATIKERKFLEGIGGNWRSHQIKVGYIWKEENE